MRCSTFTGNLELSGLEAIPRGRAKYFALASPSYIKKFGYPHHPSELSQHFCADFFAELLEPVQNTYRKPKKKEW